MENDINQIIARILSGNSLSADFLSLSEWLNEDAKNKKEFQMLKSYWDAEVSFQQSINSTLSVEQLRKKIDAREKRAKIKRIRLAAYPIAAAIALLLAIGGIIHQNTRKPEAGQYYTYLTDKNKSHVTLDDGTKIILNKNSRLTYSNAYGTDKRRVSLEGEAYFEVTKNPEQPFIVDMGNAYVQVLGTAFSIKADKGNDEIKTVLLEGSIRFESSTQKILMVPNQELTFIRSTDKINIRSVNARDNMAWKDGLLRYKSIALCTLLNELEKRYDTPIRVENKKLLNPNVTVSGTFTEDQSLKDILQVISRSLPIKWSQHDGTYYIR